MNNYFDKQELHSPVRFLWLTVPFFVLGIAALGGGYTVMTALYVFKFYKYLLLFASFGFPLGMGVFGGRFTVHCLWRASFRGNNRKSTKFAIGFPLCLEVGILYFAGMMLAYAQLQIQVLREPFHLVTDFISHETTLVILLPFQLVLLLVVLIGTMWAPYRFP